MRRARLRIAHDGRQGAHEALARLRQLGRQQRRARMHFGAHMRRHQADDAFGDRRRHVVPRGAATGTEPVHPERAVWVQQYLGHLRVFERRRDLRSHGGAQHADAALGG